MLSPSPTPSPLTLPCLTLSLFLFVMGFNRSLPFFASSFDILRFCSPPLFVFVFLCLFSLLLSSDFCLVFSLYFVFLLSCFVFYFVFSFLLFSPFLLCVRFPVFVFSFFLNFGFLLLFSSLSSRARYSHLFFLLASSYLRVLFFPFRLFSSVRFSFSFIPFFPFFFSLPSCGPFPLIFPLFSVLFCHFRLYFQPSFFSLIFLLFSYYLSFFPAHFVSLPSSFCFSSYFVYPRSSLECLLFSYVSSLVLVSSFCLPASVSSPSVFLCPYAGIHAHFLSFPLFPSVYVCLSFF